MTTTQWTPTPIPEFMINAFLNHSFVKDTETEITSVDIVELSEYAEMSPTANKIYLMTKFQQAHLFQAKETRVPYNDNLKVSDLKNKIVKNFKNKDVILINQISRKILLQKNLLNFYVETLAKNNNYELVCFDNGDTNVNLEEIIAPFLWKETAKQIGKEGDKADKEREEGEPKRCCRLF